VRFVHYRPAARVVAVATLLALSTTSATPIRRADPIDPACVTYTPAGRAGVGSLADVAQQPLAVAISRISQLSALSPALSGQASALLRWRW
jgi:hypothetical protein